jgi:hypothetical protein
MSYYKLLYPKLYLKLLNVIGYILTYYRLFTLCYFKLNYLTSPRLYFRLFFFKLLYVISNFTLDYSRSLYSMLLEIILLSGIITLNKIT